MRCIVSLRLAGRDEELRREDRDLNDGLELSAAVLRVIIVLDFMIVMIIIGLPPVRVPTPWLLSEVCMCV